MAINIPNYSILKRLGNQKKRKFGEVFLLQNNRTQEFVVLKHVKKNENTLSIADRLKKEATFSFDQKGLPQTIDLIETDNEIFLLKPYINGITLDEYWKKIKPRSRFKIWKEIILGLRDLFNTLKEKRIVHCDIKPSNILIEENNNILQIHILDFGMAVRMSEIKKTKTLFPLGYAAPELILNHLSSIDHTTDLFSLGIVSWQLFNGTLPLSHANPSVFTNLQITHPLPNSSGLPKNLFPILSKMCHKHSFSVPPNQLYIHEVENLLKDACKERYQSLDEVIEAINSIKPSRSFIRNLSWR